MKKLTNWELCQEIVVYGQAINRMIEDIQLTILEAAKLEMSDSLREVITKVITQYNNQLLEIAATNWINYSNQGVKKLFKTFRKGYLLNFQDRMKDDLTVLSEYQGELLKALDYIHKVQTKAAAINEEMKNSKKIKVIEGIIEIILESGSINLSQIDNVGEVMEELESRDMNPYITADRDYIKLQKIL